MSSYISKEDVNSILLKIVEEDFIDDWWKTPIPRFNGFSPNDMWDIGHHEAVIKLCISYFSPAPG